MTEPGAPLTCTSIADEQSIRGWQSAARRMFLYPPHPWLTRLLTLLKAGDTVSVINFERHPIKSLSAVLATI